jgi:chromatin remodeling complex protein RSC6
MVTETKDDTINRLYKDIKILQLERDNKQLVLDNLLLKVLTLSRDRDIYVEKDTNNLKNMEEYDDPHQYISYLENQERDLLKIIGEFIDSYIK